MKRQQGEIYKCYCDESGLDGKSKYYFLGSIWIPAEKGQEFVNTYWRQIEKAGFHKKPKHLKWTEVPTKETCFFMGLYTILIDLFFEKKYIEFSLISVTKNEYDISYSDFEDGFYKLYFQLLFHRLNENKQYHIRIAHRDVSKKVKALSQEERHQMLKDCLNYEFFRYQGICNVLSVEPRMAGDKLLIQLADILMGAVAFHFNEEQCKDAPSRGKVFLANYIAKKLEQKSLFVKVPKMTGKFEIINHAQKNG